MSRGAIRFVALTSTRKSSGRIDENDSYFKIGVHLASRGIPVPEIIYAEPEDGFFLLEDLGDRHLQAHVLSSRNRIHDLYRGVLRLMLEMHERGREGFTADYCFDTVQYDPGFVYDRELEYFRRAFLVSLLGLDVGPEDLRRDFENLAESGGRNDSSFVMHRDFQSRNIMVRHGRLRLIDFQGMRFGPPVYDLASLLMDPYVEIPLRVRDGLRDLYWSGARRLLGGTYGRFRRDCDILSLCRNLQILAAYAYLGGVKGRVQFLRYVPAAWISLRGLLRGPLKGKFPQLEHWTDVAARNAALRIG